MKINDFTNVNENTSIYSIIWKIFLVLAFIGVLSFGYSMLSSTAKVAKKEFGAEAALKKYEWYRPLFETQQSDNFPTLQSSISGRASCG